MFVFILGFVLGVISTVIWACNCAEPGEDDEIDKMFAEYERLDGEHNVE